MAVIGKRDIAQFDQQADAMGVIYRPGDVNFTHKYHEHVSRKTFSGRQVFVP